MNDRRKPHKHRGSANRIKSWLRRPGTLKMAIAVLRLVSLVARLFDLH
jgi:hypothetical protein